MVWSISEPLSVGSLNSKFLHLTAFLHEDQEGGEATFQVNEAIENYLKPDDEAWYLQTKLVSSHAVLETALKKEDSEDDEAIEKLVPKDTNRVSLKIGQLISSLRTSHLQTLEALRLLKHSRSASFGTSLGGGLERVSSLGYDKSYSASILNKQDHDSEPFLTTFSGVAQHSTASGLSFLEINNWQVESILCLSIFCSMKPNQKLMELKVLGSCYLTELRDRIHCFSDTIFHLTRAPEQARSALLFLNNTFYNDLREAGAVDYSALLMDWIDQQRKSEDPVSRYGTVSGFPPMDPTSVEAKFPFIHVQIPDFSQTAFQSASMEGVQLKDISIQLGYPYLFLHYGNCEHILVFTELRTFHPELDSMIRAEYPVTLYQLHQRKKKCKICDIYSAAWITIDDPLAPENPCFFCRDCYRSVHTNFLGNPIYSADHLVYQYITE